VRASESTCPQCGGVLRNERGAVVRTAGAVLMGLSLTACPADDDNDDTGAGTTSMTSGSTAMPTSGSTAMPTSGSTTDIDPTTGPGPEPAYGVGATTDIPTTGGSSSSGTDTDTDTEGSSSSSSGGGGEPDYGVPETSG
jgi:hypothetical protein